jgi:alkylation response protein AidB-like acyl-CoA dehydrogenase
LPFSFTEEQSALSATIGAFLRVRCPRDFVRSTLVDTEAWRKLWDELRELDVPAMAVPESAGGLGLGAVELVAVAESAGGAAAPVPLVSTAAMLAPMVANASGEDDDRLRILRAVVEDGDTGTALVPTRESAWGQLDGSRLTLHPSIVGEAGRADWIAIPARAPEGATLVVVSTDSLPIEPLEAMDATRPLGRLELDGHRLDEPVVLAGDVERSLAIARTAVAAELVGIGQELVARSVVHARERHQFGQAIGAFQAVKHQLVDAHTAVERARSLTYRAAVEIDGHGDGDIPAALRHSHVAKASAAEAATTACRTAIQVHGGIGITAEHDVSRLYLRARQASSWLGGPEAHYAAAAALRAVAREAA